MAESRTDGRATGNPATTRPTRDDEVRQERRKRTAGSLDRTAHMKLGVPEHIRAENADQHLHWINDVGNRMHHLTTQDDYSPVVGMAPVPVGTSEDGKPIYAHLMKKPLDYWHDDQREKTAIVNANEAELIAAAERGSKIERNKSQPL